MCCSAAGGTQNRGKSIVDSVCQMARKTTSDSFAACLLEMGSVLLISLPV